MARRATNIPEGIRPDKGPLGSTVYKIRIQHNGKPTRCGTYASIAIARNTLQRIREEQATGTFDPLNYQARNVHSGQPCHPPFMSEIVDSYLQDQYHLAPASVETYRTACNKIKTHLDSVRWPDVTREMIKRLVLSVQSVDTLRSLLSRRSDDADLRTLIEDIIQQEAAAEGKPGRPKDTGGGVETLINVLRNVYNYGVAHGHPIPLVDPLYNIHTFIVDRPPFQITPYTEDEMHHYLDNLHKAEWWFKAWSYAAFGTGARSGELVGLVIPALKFHEGEIGIWRQYYDGVIQAPKYNSVRTVPMPSAADPVLQEWIERVRWERKMKGRVDEPLHWLFPSWKNPNNFPLTSNFVKTYYDAYLERIGLPPRRIHDIRHTVGTRLARQGERPEVITALLGHKDITTTFKYYIHVTTKEHRQAMDAFLNRPDRPICQTCKRPMTNGAGGGAA